MRRIILFGVLLGLALVLGGCEDKPKVVEEKTTVPTVEPAEVVAEPVEAAEPAPIKSKAATQAFFDAALEGRADFVVSEFEAGVGVDAPNPNGQTALMLAAFNGHTELVKMLIGRGADVNFRDATDRTALMYSSSGPFPKTVELLLDQGAEVNAVDNHEAWTALMFAGAEGQGDNVMLLLEHGADVTLQDIDGDTAASFAAKAGHAAVAKMIGEYGGK